MSLKASTLFDVSGKHALVTGGGRGIGLYIADALVQNGAHVYISSRNAIECARVAALLSAAGPGTCTALPEDLGAEQGCMSLAKARSPACVSSLRRRRQAARLRTTATLPGSA